MPERARVGLDAGHADIGVAVEPAEAPQPQQPVGGDHAERMQRRVQPRHVMPLGGEEDVAVRVLEADRGRVQLGEEEVRDDVERAEAGAEMTRARAFHRHERVETAHVRQEREPHVVVPARAAHRVERATREIAQVG